MFLRHSPTNSIISAIGIVGGTKSKPLSLQKGVKVQEDNVLVEFNIKPANSYEELYNNLQTALEVVTKHVKTKNSDLDLSIQASNYMDPFELVLPEAKEFGCDPEVIVWSNNKYTACCSPENTLRTAGGHIHVGYDEVLKSTNQKIIKYLDVNLGLPSLFLDFDDDRRELYGKSGSYRNKPYGVEYRTLSNFWINDLNLCKWVFETCEKAISIDDDTIKEYEDSSSEIQEAINNSDRELAKTLIEQFLIEIPFHAKKTDKV